MENNYTNFRSLIFVYFSKIINKVIKYHYLGCEITLKKNLQYCGTNVRIEQPPRLLTGEKFIVIGNNTFIHKGVYLGVYKTDQFSSPEIRIGENVRINYNCQITAIKRIVIGDNTLIGSNTVITDHSHGDISKESLNEIPVKRRLESKGDTIIGNNVWIGSGVAILSGVEIGNNCIIGANTVVTKSYPDNSVIAGNPSTIIKNLL